MTITLSTEQKLILKDLCQKYPAGPKGRLEKGDYRVITDWVEAYKRDVKMSVLREDLPDWRCEPDRLKSFGYDASDIYRLCCAIRGTQGIPEEDAVKVAVRGVCPGESPIANSRRARLIRTRLAPIYRTFMRRGAAGLWNVEARGTSWGSPFNRGVAVWAENEADAEANYRLIEPMLGDNVGRGSLTIRFEGLGTTEEAYERNKSSLFKETEALQRDIAQNEERVRRDRIKLAAAQERAMSLLGAISLGVAPLSEDAPSSEAEEVA